MKYLHFLLIASLFTCFVACDDDDDNPPPPENEEELITTVRLVLTDQEGTTSTAEFTDLDGVGGDAPSIDTLMLSPNQIYRVETLFLNETETPAEDITEEVREESNEHYVLYTPDDFNAIISITDQDDNGDPLGLTAEMVIGDASTGSLMVTLWHEPVKSGNDIMPGETDIEVEFPVVIQ